MAAMVYLRELREHQGLSQSDIGRQAGVESKQVYRWERGENEPSAAALVAFVRTVRGRFEDIAKLLLLDGDAIVNEEVARALARDRIQEISLPEDEQADRLYRMAELVNRLRIQPHRFDLWLGYGERLIEEIDSD